MNIIGRPTSDTLKSLQFNTMTLEQAYPVGGGAIGDEMPQIGEDPGGYPSQARILYWYHPDYIQNVDLVTDLDGEAYELFLYNPWGEELHHWSSNSSSWTSPYRFNAKEVDPETGLAYYGARYYQSKLGVWLSVDPLAAVYPHVSPYNFVENNPIYRIDPTGLGPEDPTILDEVTVTAKAPNWLSRTWFKVKQFLKSNEFTASVDANIDLGIQAGVKMPFGQVQLNASKVELFSGGVDLTKREGYIDNSIADDGAIVSQEASIVVKLPVRLPGEGRNFSLSAQVGQTQRITDNTGWLENGGYSSSGYETYGDVSILVPVVRTSNPDLTRINQDPVSVTSSAKATTGTNFTGLDIGGGANFILGVNVNLKVGFNAKK